MEQVFCLTMTLPDPFLFDSMLRAPSPQSPFESGSESLQFSYQRFHSLLYFIQATVPISTVPKGAGTLRNLLVASFARLVGRLCAFGYENKMRCLI